MARKAAKYMAKVPETGTSQITSSLPPPRPMSVPSSPISYRDMGEGPIKWKREERIVVALDIGTTRTAVAFSYCYPDDVPDVRMVNKWPGQPEAAGDSKIPSLVAYKDGILEACGAEALEFIDDDEYEVAKWFKLNLHPESMKSSDKPPAYGDTSNQLPNIEIPPLPTAISLTQVYTDFLSYIYNHTHKFFIENTPAGNRIWDRLLFMGAIHFVLAVPNGWEADQHLFLRGAAISSGLVKEDDVEDRLRFVTEGEASVHYALAHTASRSWLKPGAMFAVSDAGGSTVDTTLYECKDLGPPLKLEEACASECVQAGGVFIDRAASRMLAAKLQDSRFGNDEFIKLMVVEFEKKIKRIFDYTQTSSIIHFGRNNDNDRAHGILKGKISLDKDEVKGTFTDATAKILDSISHLLRGRPVQYLLLVGGFGESPFLRKLLRETFSSQGTEVVTVDEPSKKAAAEGAAIWYIKHLVVARAARVTLGVCLERLYLGELPGHRRREHLSYISPMGTKLLNAFFEPLLEKNTVVDENLDQERTFYDAYVHRPENLGQFSVPIYAWEGEGKTGWCKDDRGELMPKIRPLCTVVADLSGLKGLLKKRDGINGARYWVVEFVVSIKFGGTQLQAKLKWKEKGVACEGPVTILPQSIY